MIKKKPSFLVPLAIIAILSISVSVATGPYIARKAADFQNNVLSLSQSRVPPQLEIDNLLRQMSDFFVVVALVALITLLIVGVLSVLFVTGLVVGVKETITKGDTSLGGMFSGAFNYGFHALLSEIVAWLVVLWPLWLVLIFTLLGLLTMNAVFLILVGILFIVLVVWSIITLYWMSRILGLIHLIISAITALFLILILVHPLSIIPFAILFFLMLGMILVWVFLSTFTIAYLIPASIVFEGKKIIDGAKRAFEFTRDFTMEFGLIVLIAVVVLMIIALISSLATQLATPGLYAHQLSGGGVLIRPEMIYNAGVMVIDSISEIITTVIFGTYFALVFALLFAYGRGFKKLPGKRRVIEKPPATSSPKPPKHLPSPPPKKPESPKWKCSSCGSENDLKDTNCWMCGADKK